MRNRVTSDLNGVTDLRVEVDGVPIRHLELFRFTSPVFSVTLPQNNVLQATGYTAAVPGAIFLAIAEGFYVMLKPLPVGEHTIAMRGRIPAIALTLDVTLKPLPVGEHTLRIHSEVPSFAFVLDVTYHLTVVPLTFP